MSINAKRQDSKTRISFMPGDNKGKNKKKSQCPSLNISLNLNKNTINSIFFRNEDLCGSINADVNLLEPKVELVYLIFLTL